MGLRFNGNTYVPSADFQIKDTVLVYHPLFQVDGVNIGTIRNWYDSLSTNYGFFESSKSGSHVINYFQDPVLFNKIGINGSLGKLVSFYVPTNTSVDTIEFVMGPAAGINSNYIPLIIDTNGISVKSKLITEQFQLTTNPDLGYVLLSDAYGNGSWVNPSSFLPQYWQQNGLGDIYTTYRYVGIGTSTPSEKLEICPTNDQGGIALNQLSTNKTGSEIKFEYNSVPQCAVGQNFDANRTSFFIWSDIASKMEFYMDLTNGMTGIGTEWPSANLEVAGTFKATAVGIGINPPTSSDSYKLFVDGGIAAREVKVTINTFPDYVFSDSYKLLPTNELEKYVIKNKHLPGIPSSEDIDKNKGIEVGAMQVKLLEKIEEQSLYIISLQKQIDDLKKQMESLTRN